jgi:hypothetical protein
VKPSAPGNAIRTNEYPPPARGMAEASSAYANAVSKVTAPLRANASSEAGPDSPAAIPVRTNMPAPIMAPTPIIVASNRPKSRAKVVLDASLMQDLDSRAVSR